MTKFYQLTKNPLNLRPSSPAWRGQCGVVNGFSKFTSYPFAFRAFFLLCRTYYYKYNVRTLYAFISRYAPPAENDTYRYFRFVRSLLDSRGFSHLDYFSLDEDYLKNLADFISCYESGVKAGTFSSSISNGYNLEAMFIAYSIIEDRTKAIIIHVNKYEVYLKKYKNKPSLYTKITYIQKMKLLEILALDLVKILTLKNMRLL